MDMKDWRKVIDYSHMLCRSWQHLRFAPRVVRYDLYTAVVECVTDVLLFVSACMYFCYNYCYDYF